MIRRLLSFVLLVRRVFRHSTPKTNSTFFRRATMPRNDKDQRPPSWYWLPGYARLLWKIAAIFGPPLVAWWWIELTGDARAVLVFFLLFVGGNVVVAAISERRRDRKHRREVAEPLQGVVDNILKTAA